MEFIVADDQKDILEQFKEFLDAKAASEKEQADEYDFDVEIWDEKGRGVRTKRSHAKPFLQSLGIDLDPTPDSSDDKSGGNSPAKTRQVPASSTARSAGVAKKYFTKPAK